MEDIRFTDILTTSTSVANFLRASLVEKSHMIAAIDLLEEKISPEDLGTPQPFLGSRPGAGPGVAPEIAAMVRKWWDSLGQDPQAVMSGEKMDAFRREIEAMKPPNAE